jgi:diguanylate cyclase (GGDEF)-like protein
MRVITGWRFFVYIALPLVLASLGAMNLTYDLLRRVEIGSNAAEHERNRLVLEEAVASTEADLARLVMENAQWEEAVKETAGKPNATWFASTWTNSLSLGQSYDMVALFDAETGALLLSRSREGSSITTEALVGQRGIEPFKDLLSVRKFSRGVTSGFQLTSVGPVAMAMAPIMSPTTLPDGNNRILYLGRKLDQAWLDGQQKKLLVAGLSIAPGSVEKAEAIPLKSADGTVVLSLAWHNRMLGDIITASAWSKASGILSFLIVVMTGIGIVCWKLVKQLLADEDTAQHNAMHDHLTGLPNRLALTREMEKLQSSKEPYTLAFADLDGFKEVNDSFGHEYGDKLIKMVANGIRSLAHNAKLCCRLGGDEFVVLFAGAQSTGHAVSYAEQVISMMKQPFEMDGRLASVGASVGLATCNGQQDVMEMMRRSDIAMYKAKGSGKGRFCVFNESFDNERNENLAIASELKSIIKSKNLDVMFQPVVNAKTRAITGLEALARWPSTSVRRVEADRFVAVAENAGLIDDLGHLILEKACVAATEWRDVRLAINISAIQLNNPGFAKRSLATLESYNIAPNRVEFEITETSLIHDTERAKQVFKSLQAAGVKIALDDFGTGFSSIGYLRTFQFDRIKIDKSIVNKVLSSTSELAVMQGTLLVARGLSAEVTAEGVETEDEASMLRLAGCTELQGYLFHKPMTVLEVTNAMRREKVAAVPRTVVA